MSEESQCETTWKRRKNCDLLSETKHSCLAEVCTTFSMNDPPKVNYFTRKYNLSKPFLISRPRNDFLRVPARLKALYKSLHKRAIQTYSNYEENIFPRHSHSAFSKVPITMFSQGSTSLIELLSITF